MNASPSTALRFLGFKDHEQPVHFGCKEGTVLPNVEYLYREVTEGKLTNHQYVSLVNYDGNFCEAVFEAYVAPKNTRVKGNFPQRENQLKGFVPVVCSLYRTTEDLLRALTPLHDAVPPEKKENKLDPKKKA